MIERIAVSPDGWLEWNGRRVRAALGRGGVTLSKREGDGGTPAGTFALRSLLYRADRLVQPVTLLDCAPIAEDSGWSDDPADPAYNRPVRLPHAFGHERLWREDGVYDLIVPLGYNDAPPIAGRGSAIFLHVARPAYAPTEGCVALALNDLLLLLADCGPETRLEISDGRR
ncbi:MAG TPA: L,D-transpeptidase family protein [Alphaproteobacteria bacterium]|nr:L,D-transpeptidase family protein [Alphaproteobacteria bacterium]